MSSRVRPRARIRDDRAGDPLDGLERPRARKRLSSAEVALLKFLSRRKRRRKAKAVGEHSAAQENRVAA